jgi:hypothetical protein
MPDKIRGADPRRILHGLKEVQDERRREIGAGDYSRCKYPPQTGVILNPA